MSNTLIAMIRTWVPIGVGSLISFLVTLGVELSAETEAAMVVALTGLAIGLYYSVVTWLSKRWPGLQVLLGAKATPTYDN